MQLAMPIAARKRGRSLKSAQTGFTLIELTVVFLILVVLAVIAVPRIQSLIIENKTPTVARELQSAVTRMRGSRAGAGATPYTGIAIAELGANLRNTSFTIDGPPATAVSHTLGSGAAAPTITIGAVNTGAGAGSGFTVLFTDVDAAGCGPLASTLAGAAEAVQIGGGAAVTTTGVGANAKAIGGAFNPGAAQTACGAADAVDMAFVFR